MNTRPQITSVEPTIRIPAWRSASPKNFEHAQAEDLADDLRRELDDLAERLDPALGVLTIRSSSVAHLAIVVISGCVASSVWVNA